MTPSVAVVGSVNVDLVAAVESLPGPGQTVSGPGVTRHGGGKGANVATACARLAPETRRSLLSVFRGLVGLDAEAVEKAFTAFVHKHPRLTSQQLRFLQVLQNYIAQNGGIELGARYTRVKYSGSGLEKIDGSGFGFFFGGWL